MKIYILREKHIDQFGEEKEEWKDVAYTERHDKAVNWRRSSEMLLHKDYIELRPQADA